MAPSTDTQPVGVRYVGHYGDQDAFPTDPATGIGRRRQFPAGAPVRLEAWETASMLTHPEYEPVTQAQADAFDAALEAGQPVEDAIAAAFTATVPAPAAEPVAEAPSQPVEPAPEPSPVPGLVPVDPTAPTGDPAGADTPEI